MTQSAISKQIADIEAALGEPVVRRQGNGLVLTPIGQVLAQRANSVLHQLERARDEVVAMRGGFGGRVAVGSVSTVNSTLVPQAILAMKQQTPNVVVVVEENTADRLLNRLLNRDLDLAIVRMWHPIAHEELGQQLLGSEGLVVVVGRDHPLADFTTLDWDDTMRFPWVVPRSGSTAGGALEAMLAAQGLRIPVGQVESISLALIASLLSTGQFIGLLPGKLALAWETERRISVLPLQTKDLLSARSVCSGAAPTTTPHARFCGIAWLRPATTIYLMNKYALGSCLPDFTSATQPLQRMSALGRRPALASPRRFLNLSCGHACMRPYVAPFRDQSVTSARHLSLLPLSTPPLTPMDSKEMTMHATRMEMRLLRLHRTEGPMWLVPILPSKGR